jgi:hypothetical protein
MPRDAVTEACTIAPPMMHPPDGQHVCSATDLVTDAASVVCFDLDASSACYGCILGGAPFDPRWGPIIPTSRFDLEQFYNTPGCVDLVLGMVATEPRSCGNALYARAECLELACDYGAAIPPCPFNPDAGSCEEQALRGPCKPYEDDVRSDAGPCAGWLTADGGPTTTIAPCFPHGPLIDPKNRCGYEQSLATVFCGR